MLQLTTMTQKGQVTIPLPLREKLGLTTGTKIHFRYHPREPDKLILASVGDLLSLKGAVKTRKRYSKAAARRVYLPDVLAGKI